MKFRNINPALMTIVLLITLSALPLQAAIKHNFPTQKTINLDNRQLLAFSWGELWDKLRRKKGKRGSRGDEDKKFFCMIAPGGLKDPSSIKASLKVWSSQPVFLWKGEIKGIEVRHTRSNKLMWSQQVEPTTRGIVYQGEPLQPGEAYFWRETVPDAELPSRQSFRIMKAEERDSISTDLKQLESNLKAKGAKPEEIVLARIDYFVEKQLWSDVLREIYLVQNPSPELKELVEQIQSNDFCSDDKDEQPISLYHFFIKMRLI